MIDMHIHSIYSDGTYTPEEIVKIAKEKKLDLIALTDHNALIGLSNFRDACEKYGQKALAGIEISTVYNGEEIHLIGYFPVNSNFHYAQYDVLNETNKRYHDSKIMQLEAIVEKLSKDFPVSVEEFRRFLLDLKDNDNINRVHISNYLMHKGIVGDVHEGFKKYLNKESKYYVEREQTKLLDALKIATDAGGFATIAHIGQYHLTDDEVKKMLEDISKITDEIGVELFHYDHNDTQIERLLKITKDIENKTSMKVIFTAGSDCHGLNKPNEIGKPYEDKLSDEHMKLYKDVSDNFVSFVANRYALEQTIVR